MSDSTAFFKSLQTDYQGLSLKEMTNQMSVVYGYAHGLADLYSKAKIENKLTASDFFQLWHPFVDNFVIWSSNFNQEVKKRIYQNNIDDIFLFQKYCFIYQYWWILFHLVTKHFANYRRYKLIELENKLIDKIKNLEKLINSNEVVKGFTTEEMDKLFSWKENG